MPSLEIRVSTEIMGRNTCRAELIDRADLKHG